MPKLLIAFLFFLFSSGVYSQENQKLVVEVDSTVSSNENYSIEEDYEKIEDTIMLLKVDSSLYPLTKTTALIDSAKNIAKQEDYWYVTANFETKKNKEEVEEPSNNSGFIDFLFSDLFNVILWVLFGGIILTIILFFLTENDIIRFKKKAIPLATIEAEENEDNIFEIDFEKRIAAAEATNNFTLATRLLLFRLLKKLSTKKHIIYNPQKTNLDYQIELSSQSFSQNTSRCFYFYDNICYGDFEISKSQFVYVKDIFNQTEKLI